MWSDPGLCIGVMGMIGRGDNLVILRKWHEMLGLNGKTPLNPSGPCCAAEFLFPFFLLKPSHFLGDSRIQSSRNLNLPEKKSISKNGWTSSCQTYTHENII